MNYILVGGGLVGMGTALALKRLQPDARIQILEKEPRVGQHQSTHNSGVLHAGLYYKPGSLKARLAVDGIRRMVAFCEEHGVKHEICGKLVVATTPEEVARLHTLIERGTQNGLRGLRWLEREAFREIEPHAAGLAAVQVPEEGIVDYHGVCAAMEKTLRAQGVLIATGARVKKSVRGGTSGAGQSWRVETTAGDFTGDFLINCAGLHCDRVAESAGEKREARIVPFRGEYYKLKPSAQSLVRHLIYPVPDPAFPFLGVHFTRMIEGGVEAGPNAVLAYAREGYTKWQIRPGDLFDALSYGGLWAFMKKHRAMAWEEVRRSFSKKLFCQSLQTLVPELTEADLEPGGAGVRAQAMLPDGTLIQDFHLVERAGALHVLNAPSPAATASLAIGEYVAARVVGGAASV
ncbi:L-2-hydroxyglutarate oxidase [Nibricoccus aquaticus]|uniref:L-2-hydroxyglutarate oxidase n=1 Tax=Nibricoccus aquaticus TaxID=2576891 RepID=A0A290QFI7_9BACT|nr:L-2-hydroxyglutarate oxidase [Nibricoccus aquaticus]ATC64098.1 L-2-hydroxyglutarate oxidase [Nibricoccus aquaticus]